MTLFVTLTAAYGLLVLLVFLFQARLVWFPGAGTGLEPTDVGLAGASVRIPTPDGETLHAWRLGPGATEPGADGRLVVLHCHGNAGELSGRAFVARALHELDCDVLLFDYRGYGESTGSPTEEGTYVDATAAFDWLVASGVSQERIVLFGESLGGAVAIETALRRTPAALVLESAFTSLADVGAKAYPFLPVRWLSRIDYDNLEKLPRVSPAVPVLVLHSPADEVVPFAHGEALVAARRGATLVRTEGGHNDGGFVSVPSARERLKSFLDDVRNAGR